MMQSQVFFEFLDFFQKDYTVKKLPLYFSKPFTVFDFIVFNPFHATGLFPYPLKTLENLWFCGGFREYIKRPLAWNGLIRLTLPVPIQGEEKILS